MSKTHKFESIVPLPIPDNILKELVKKAKDWALMHGAAMRSKTSFSEDALQFAPFILLPSAFPRKEFFKAVEIQIVLNEMMHRVAHTPAFLKNCLKETVQVDEFTGNLFKIYETVLDEGITQPLSLGMLRSDLMLETDCPTSTKSCHHNTPYCSWKQVEINTIASGFGWLGPASAVIQRSKNEVLCAEAGLTAERSEAAKLAEAHKAIFAPNNIYDFFFKQIPNLQKA